MSDLPQELKDDIHQLGTFLGQTMFAQLGEGFVGQVETIRKLAKKGRQSKKQSNKELKRIIASLQSDEKLNIARAFNQFLNLSNIAEQHHQVRLSLQKRYQQNSNPFQQIDEVFSSFKPSPSLQSKLLKILQSINIDLVFTAHPTEVVRRTLIQKYNAIASCLETLDETQTIPRKQAHQVRRLKRLISECWHTYEFRDTRPSPIDEARWGFGVIEQSLWKALPDFLRHLDERMQHHLGVKLPLNVSLFTFSSWVGGDRDGNPNVTSYITQQVLDEARQVAADLYMADLDVLQQSLAMDQCNQEVMAIACGILKAKKGSVIASPYRVILQHLRDRMMAIRHQTPQSSPSFKPSQAIAILSTTELLNLLMAMHRSLHQKGMGEVADGFLLDTIRRAQAFGTNLIKLDIRQESSIHSKVIAELCQDLAITDYAAFNEEERVAFLTDELKSKRPLIPSHWRGSKLAMECLKTFQTIAQTPRESLHSYVISMAKKTSHILEVALLMKVAEVKHQLPIVPLFETLDDLNQSTQVLEDLFKNDWYQAYAQGAQEVMIGYSDSAKDAGTLASSWAQYQAQTRLSSFCTKNQIKLTFFHGRGGTVGRGGVPANRAITAQPVSATSAQMRVTEQGEMIRWKYGLSEIAMQTMALYSTALIQTQLSPPAPLRDEYQHILEQIAQKAALSYREMVYHNQDFIDYFKAITPTHSLGELPTASRPAKRRQDGGLESLRAIPWIFAWMQVRLMLPAWLGSDEALSFGIDKFGLEKMRTMYRNWSFFEVYVDMIEMVLAKADISIAKYYERRLLSDEVDLERKNQLKNLGKSLRTRFKKAVSVINQIKDQSYLLENNPQLQAVLEVRNAYTDPLHFLQAELLKKPTLDGNEQKALMVSMAGIAAGIRNTG